jgi:hypothetical protein
MFEQRFIFVIALITGVFVGLFIGLGLDISSEQGRHPFYDVPQFWAGVLAIVAALIAGYQVRNQRISNEKISRQEIHNRRVAVAASVYAELGSNMRHYKRCIENRKMIAHYNLEKDALCPIQKFSTRVYDKMFEEIGQLPPKVCKAVIQSYIDCLHTHETWYDVVIYTFKHNDAFKDLNASQQTERLKTAISGIYTDLMFDNAIAMKKLCKVTGRKLGRDAVNIIEERQKQKDRLIAEDGASSKE